MPAKRFNRLLLLATLIFALIWGILFSGHKTVFYGDSNGYYRYLPAAFIYHNLISQTPLPADRGIPGDILYFNRVLRDDKGKPIINQYTYGIALMEAPFFFAAHAWELARGTQANGFTKAYDNAVKLSTMFYALLGLMLVYRILLRYYGENLATLGVVALFIGTNLFWFTLLQCGMSHVPLFFLYALLMYLVIRVHEQPRRGTFAAIGFVIGLITVIRPTDIICISIPLLYNVYSLDTIRQKFRFIRQNVPNLLLLSLVAVVPLIPQMLFWKAITGHYIFYSYGDQSFDWQHPKIIEGLFHYSNGWLPYTPLMILALLGLLCYRRIRQWAWCTWLLLPAYSYIIYSWYCYRYINGLGSRPMIHLYPLLALAFVAFLQWTAQRRLWLKVAVGAVALFFVSLNISYSYQQMQGLIWSEESNYVFAWQMLYRTELRYNDLVVHDIPIRQPDTTKLVKIATLATETYSDSTLKNIQPDPITGHKYVYHMQGEEFQQTTMSGRYNSQQHKGARWIKCSGRFMYPSPPDYFRHMFVVSIQDKLWHGAQVENKTFDWRTIEGHDHLTLFDYKLSTWGTVYFFVPVPENIADGDEIKLYGWSLDKSDLYLDDLSLELYK